MLSVSLAILMPVVFVVRGRVLATTAHGTIALGSAPGQSAGRARPLAGAGPGAGGSSRKLGHQAPCLAFPKRGSSLSNHPVFADGPRARRGARLCRARN